MKDRLTDIQVIAAIQEGKDSTVHHLFLTCRQYFYERHHGAFDFRAAESAHELADIFQDAFLALWIEIKSRRIYLRDGAIWRTDRFGRERPMSASLLTYLMAIARYRNYELIREEEIYLPADADAPDSCDEPPEELTAADIVAQCINVLPPRCIDILTKFYYRGMSLDEILASRPENRSKDGLKSGKSKCMARLKALITEQLRRHNLKLPDNGKH